MTKAKRHLAKAKKVKVVDTKKANDLLLQEKWAIAAWCMQYYDVNSERMMSGTYPAAEKHFGGRVTERTIREVTTEYLKECKTTKFPIYSTRQVQLCPYVFRGIIERYFGPLDFRRRQQARSFLVGRHKCFSQSCHEKNVFWGGRGASKKTSQGLKTSEAFF